MTYKKPGMKWYSFLMYWLYFGAQIFSIPYYVLLFIPLALSGLLFSNPFMIVVVLATVFNIALGFTIYAHMHHFSTSVIKLVICDAVFDILIATASQLLSIKDFSLITLILPIVNIIYLYKRRFLFVNQYSIFKHNADEIAIDCNNLDPFIDYLNGKANDNSPIIEETSNENTTTE